jgi:hypothetical protein
LTNWASAPFVSNVAITIMVRSGLAIFLASEYELLLDYKQSLMIALS